MSVQRLSVGIGLSDRMQPLLERQITNDRVDLDFDLSAVDNIFWRALHSDDFDVTEMSLAAYSILHSRGENTFVGIPVFTSRIFRHNSVYVSAASNITKPSDLAGRRIGVPEYQMTAVVWMRGVLQEYHGVKAKDVAWFKGGVNKAGRKERIALELPPQYRVNEIPPSDTLDDYLCDGRIDALIAAKMPESFQKGNPAVRRLFPDVRAAEEDYFRQSGIFPIMHVLVMRRHVYERDRALARAVYDAFAAAKAYSEKRLYDPDALSCMVPWLISEMERTYEVLGHDYWPYGLNKNRNGLSVFLRYLADQDLLRKPLCVEDLFAEELLDT
ncbi:MAG TPA: ABC transporter substrate-binding protein [Bradyrhizobium sp.]